MPQLSLSNDPISTVVSENLASLQKQAKIKVPGISVPVVVEGGLSYPQIPSLASMMASSSASTDTSVGGAVPATGSAIGISNDIAIPPTSKIGRAVVRAALQFRGVPYVWGGESPSGFDCSGLMKYVFAKYGVDIPRVTYDQFRAGTPVPVKAMRPGDLVFFHMEAQGPGHVGIYIGNKQFLQAPQTGDVVKISPLDMSHVVGIRRFG